jgi:cold-inducible RNA-binding protein
MPSMNLYVGNLSYNVTDADLAEMFAPYGEVVSAKIITERFSGQSKGFGFVEMANRSEAEQAIAALNGKEVDRRQIRVNEARPRTDSPRGGGRGGGGSRGGGFGGGQGGGRY